MVGVAKEMPHNGAMETLGEVQIELVVFVKSVARVTRRNMSYHQNLHVQQRHWQLLCTHIYQRETCAI